jgi:hypothetical protein
VDGVIFLDFPRRDSNAQLVDALAEALNSSRKPVYWMAGPGLDLSRWWRFQKSLPLATQPSRGPERPVTMIPDAAGMAHAVGRLAESPDENRALWEELPPSFSVFSNVQPAAGTQIIAVSDQPVRGAAAPMLIAHKSADRKSILLLAHGLWMWNLKLVGIGREPVAYRHLMIQGMRWLVTNEDTKLVRFTTNKLIYRGGEAVEMNAQVYFEDYRPRTGARVSARLTGNGFDREILFDEVGDGLYRALPGSLPGGDYDLRGQAGLNGRVLGEDYAKFSVEPFSVEHLTTSMDEVTLRHISEASNGRYLLPDSLEALSKISFPAEKVEEKRELAAWGHPEALFILIVLLGMEWFLRKRNGML